MRDKLKAVHRYADRRLGVVTRDELRRLGLTEGEIKQLIACGFLLRLHRGVYRLPGSTPSLRQRAYAAAKACGDLAVVSRRSAAELWGLLPEGNGPLHITTPNGQRARHGSIAVHRTLYLPKSDVTELIPVPVTRAPRTIADLSAVLREEALDEAIRRRLIKPVDVLGYNRALDKLALDRLEHGAPEQKIERLAIAALKKAGLPPPVRQHNVHIAGRTFRIDLAYPRYKVAIELEGEAPHWGRDRWQYDHERRNALELDGWRQLAYTWWDVRHGPEKLGMQAGRWVPALRSR